MLNDFQRDPNASPNQLLWQLIRYEFAAHRGLWLGGLAGLYGLAIAFAFYQSTVHEYPWGASLLHYGLLASLVLVMLSLGIAYSLGITLKLKLPPEHIAHTQLHAIKAVLILLLGGLVYATSSGF